MSNPKLSAGLLMYRLNQGITEFFLVHPGGPFLKHKDEGVWTIPKGRPEEGERYLDTACREFFEETNITPEGPFFYLDTIRQKGGKLVHAWAFEGEWSPDTGIESNTFTMEWPPGSGKMQEFPEHDKAAWFDRDTAAKKIIEAQLPFLDRVIQSLDKQ